MPAQREHLAHARGAAGEHPVLDLASASADAGSMPGQAARSASAPAQHPAVVGKALGDAGSIEVFEQHLRVLA